MLWFGWYGAVRIAYLRGDVASADGGLRPKAGVQSRVGPIAPDGGFPEHHSHAGDERHQDGWNHEPIGVETNFRVFSGVENKAGAV